MGGETRLLTGGYMSYQCNMGGETRLLTGGYMSYQCKIVGDDCYDECVFPDETGPEKSAESYAIDQQIEVDCEIEVQHIESSKVFTYHVKVIDYPDVYEILPPYSMDTTK
jgi:hypothetical protein